MDNIFIKGKPKTPKRMGIRKKRYSNQIFNLRNYNRKIRNKTAKKSHKNSHIDTLQNINTTRNINKPEHLLTTRHIHSTRHINKNTSQHINTSPYNFFY